MSKHWWKIVGAALVIFSIIGGLMVPLGPRLSEVRLNSKQDSIWILHLEGVNTHFDKATHFYIKPVASIKRSEGEPILKASAKIISEKQAVLEIPNVRGVEGAIENTYWHLIASNKTDGTLPLFEAIWVDSIQVGGKIIADSPYELQLQDKKQMNFPNRVILNETIRNLIFHVPMWFAMIFILLIGFVSGILYLLKGDLHYDLMAYNAARTGLFFGVLGIFTGMLWANYTWGAPWTNDPKLNGAAIGMLVYAAYLILRSSVNDEIKKAKLASVYNIFAFVIYIVFIFIMPRINDSLHPGNGGNPGFKQYDLDSTLRIFFYPAVIGWMLIAMMVHGMLMKYEKLKQIIINSQHE